MTISLLGISVSHYTFGKVEKVNLTLSYSWYDNNNENAYMCTYFIMLLRCPTMGLVYESLLVSCCVMSFRIISAL